MRQSLPEAMNELVVMTNCLGVPIEGREQRSHGAFLQIAMLVHTIDTMDFAVSLERTCLSEWTCSGCERLLRFRYRDFPQAIAFACRNETGSELAYDLRDEKSGYREGQSLGTSPTGLRPKDIIL